MSSTSNETSRRKFIKNSAILSAGVTILPKLTYAINSTEPKKKLNIGLIGIGLRGTNHLNNLLKRNDISIKAVCDIDPARIAAVVKIFKANNIQIPSIFQDTSQAYIFNSAIEYKTFFASGLLHEYILAFVSLKGISNYSKEHPHQHNYDHAS